MIFTRSQNNQNQQEIIRSRNNRYIIIKFSYGYISLSYIARNKSILIRFQYYSDLTTVNKLLAVFLIFATLSILKRILICELNFKMSFRVFLKDFEG